MAGRTLSENASSRFCNHFSIIQSHYACKMCSNYPGIKLEQRFRGKNTKLNICHHTLTSSTQLQNRSFRVVERTRTSRKCTKMKNARAKCKACKTIVFRCQICKFVTFLLPSSPWLLKLPIVSGGHGRPGDVWQAHWKRLTDRPIDFLTELMTDREAGLLTVN